MKKISEKIISVINNIVDCYSTKKTFLIQLKHISCPIRLSNVLKNCSSKIHGKQRKFIQNYVTRIFFFMITKLTRFVDT